METQRTLPFIDEAVYIKLQRTPSVVIMRHYSAIVLHYVGIVAYIHPVLKAIYI